MIELDQALLKNRTVVICGGSTGIGFETARLLVRMGATVIATGRSEAKLKAAEHSLGGLFSTHVLDGRLDADVRRFFAGLGEIDHLVLAINSGAATGLFRDITDQQFREAFENKFWAYMSALRHAAPKLRPGGSVTLVTGVSAQKSAVGISGLAATNGALEAMVGPLALEFAPTRINAVSPGVTETPYWNSVPDGMRNDFFQRAASILPVKRLGRASEIAQAILALVINEFITGSVLVIDGGLRIS
jgi:NAD(P)-dependent dehydrogenase (short-subunit alcohol dehydrogenase family)